MIGIVGVLVVELLWIGVYVGDVVFLLVVFFDVVDDDMCDCCYVFFCVGFFVSFGLDCVGKYVYVVC